ncbi:hypothetical protein HYX04_00235 [Candidatus Woesearchaeota archaeon]|nr:hypothetical protein [Candidatus Woesearchaeota archaeon]
MAKINLPKDMLQKETFKTLPAKEKEEYLSNLLKKVLDINPEGVTISQIKEATGLTYSTIWHHLEVLSCTAQALKVSHGNIDVYYPSGKVDHLNDYAKGKALYAVSTVENSQGKFVCIHEKKENRSGNQRVCSGVSVPIELIDNLVKTLGKVK